MKDDNVDTFLPTLKVPIIKKNVYNTYPKVLRKGSDFSLSIGLMDSIEALDLRSLVIVTVGAFDFLLFLLSTLRPGTSLDEEQLKYYKIINNNNDN